MDKKLSLATILFILVSAGSVFILAKDKEIRESANMNVREEAEGQIILFYGNGCPHCVIVEEYIKENKTQDKISFAQKEVYYNQNNAKELESKAKICGLPADAIGVPFLWDGSKCFIGDQEIIEFFKQQNNEK